MKQVCMLTSGHAPLDDRIFHREAKSLPKLGYTVVIIAPSSPSIRKPMEVSGIRIIPIPRRKNKRINRITVLYHLVHYGLKYGPAIYHCHEIDALWVGILLSKRKGGKVIYDAHEHFPSLMSQHPVLPEVIRPFVYFFVDRLERIACRFADRVVTVNKTLKNRYIGMRRPTTILYNCPSLRLHEWRGDHPLEHDGPIVVYNNGGVSRDRGLDRFLEALVEVKKTFPRVLFLLVGDILDDDRFRLWMDRFIRENGLAGHFHVTGWIPYEQVPAYLMEADLGVILFQPFHYNIVNSLPIKLFEYMGARKPIVACDFPEIRAVIESERCGLLVDATQPHEIAHAILYLLEHPEEAAQMGERGRQAIERTYNWERMEQILSEVYQGIVSTF